MGASIRKQSTFPLQNQPALGNVVVCDIPLTADLENMLVTLSGSVTLSGAASALVNDGIANLIDSIELIGDGRTTIVQQKFRTMVNANIFRRKLGMVPTINQPGITAAAHAFEAEGIIDLAAFGAVRPKDSNLRENAYKTLQLRLTMASAWTAVFSGGTVSTSSMSITVRAKETIELPDAKGQVTSPILRPLVSERDITVSAATTRERFRLTPEQALRGLAFRVVNGSDALSDSVLSNVRVYVGSDQRLDLTAAVIKESTKAEFVGADLTGYYFVDFADGAGAPDRLNDCLNLRNAATKGADCYVEIDTAAAGTISVVQCGFVKP